MGARGFTLIELMIVLAVGTILTTLGLVVSANIIKTAQYNQQRARVYLDTREARDRASSGLRFVRVVEVTPTQVEYDVRTSCGGPASALAVTRNYPALDSNADRTVCFDAMNSMTMVGNVIDFIPAGGAGTDLINFANDGSLDNSWGEFPNEGAYEASSCDPDRDENCGL